MSALQAFHPSETEKDDYSATRAGVQGAPVGKASIDAFLARAHVSAPVAQTTPTSTPTPPPTRTPTPTTTPTPASGPHSHETCPGLTRSTKCIDSSSHLLPEKKSSYKIPSDLAAMLAPENTVQVQQKLINSDICVIAMGDSTLEETVEDIGAMLGEVDGTRKSAEEIWKWIDTWMNATVSQSKPGAHFDAPLFRASYFPNHRKMSIVARGGRFVLYYRFIGHPEIDKNWMGLRSLLNEPLREEIVSGADKWCGNLRRVVWLQVGYHEKRQERKHFHKSGLPDVYRKVLPWVEQLAPERYWLMRQGDTWCQHTLFGVFFAVLLFLLFFFNLSLSLSYLSLSLSLSVLFFMIFYTIKPPQARKETRKSCCNCWLLPEWKHKLGMQNHHNQAKPRKIWISSTNGFAQSSRIRAETTRIGPSWKPDVPL